MSVPLGERIQRPERPSFMVQGGTVDSAKVAHVIGIVSLSMLHINERNNQVTPTSKIKIL